MEKLLIKIMATALFAMLLTFNVTINERKTDLSLGGAKLEAGILCYSQAKRNWNYAYVDCASCNRLTGWRATGGAGTCDGSGPPVE